MAKLRKIRRGVSTRREAGRRRRTGNVRGENGHGHGGEKAIVPSLAKDGPRLDKVRPVSGLGTQWLLNGRSVCLDLPEGHCSRPRELGPARSCHGWRVGRFPLGSMVVSGAQLAFTPGPGAGGPVVFPRLYRLCDSPKISCLVPGGCARLASSLTKEALACRFMGTRAASPGYCQRSSIDIDVKRARACLTS